MKLFTVVILTIPYVFLNAVDYDTDTLIITSKVLKEDRTVLIHYPASNTSTDSVTVILISEGEYAGHYYKTLLNERNGNNLVCVGIIQTDRRRDMLYVEEAEKYLEFLDKELLLFIDKRYKVKNKIIFGHSIEGSFTLYTFLNKPEMFDKYIISSPIPIVDLIAPELYTQIDSSLSKKISFYISYGSKDMKQVKKWNERLKLNLSSAQLSNIKWKAEVFEGQNHNTSPYYSIKKGFNF